MSDSRGLRQHQVIGYEYVPPNLLINGGFEIWQRGAGTFSSSLIFSSDEWMLTVAAGGTLSVTREASTKKIGTYSLKAVQAAAPNSGLSQGIEGYKSFEGLTLTFSCWVNTADANTFIFLSDFDGAVVNAASSPHSGSGQWERLTIVKTIRTGLAAVASFPHSFGLRVGITSGNSAATYYIDGATLVVGNYPEGVPFVPTNPAEDLQRCQRFYEKDGWEGFSTVGNAGAVGITYYAFGHMLTSKSATPTITLTNDGGNNGFPAGVGPATISGNSFREQRVCNAFLASLYFGSYWSAEVT